jgi:hypothetical protein
VESHEFGRLPHALADGDEVEMRLAGTRPAVFLDYEGTLTPIVDRPDDITDEHAGLAGRSTAAEYVLASPQEVERVLDGLARDDG